MMILALITLVEVFDIVKCFIIPHRVTALHNPNNRWMEKSIKLDASASDEAAPVVLKTLPNVAIENSVKGKSWLRCKPIGGKFNENLYERTSCKSKYLLSWCMRRTRSYK